MAVQFTIEGGAGMLIINNAQMVLLTNGTSVRADDLQAGDMFLSNRESVTIDSDPVVS